MADELEGKVGRGDPLKVSASTWNSIMDVVRWYKRHGQQLDKQAGIFDSIKSNLVVLIKNQLGYNLDSSFKILRLSSPLLDVADDPHTTNRRVAFDAFAPVSAGDAIVITQTPCEYELITKAVVTGITVCKVRMNNPAHEWANPIAGQVDYLDSAETGQARILWYGDSGVSGEVKDNIYLAIVNLVGVTGDLDSLESGESGTGSTLELDVVTGLCPVFEDITYEQAIAELNDLLSRVEGYEDGKVLGVVEESIEWVDPPAGPGATPGGANTQVQFNDGGLFGGNINFTFDKVLFLLATYGLTVNASLRLTGYINPTSFGTTQHDWDPTGLDNALLISFATSAAADVTGIAGGVDGRVLFLMNGSGNAVTLKAMNGGSTSGNQFGTFRDVIIPSLGGAILIYRATKWRVLGAFETTQLGTGVTGVVPIANGGTNLSTYALGDLLYSSATNVLAKLAGNTTVTKKFLNQTGNGTISGAPSWDALAVADLPGGNWITNTSGLTTGGFVLAGASGVWGATGISVTLPSAGTYRVDVQIRGEVQPGAIGAHFISVNQYNATDGTDIANSEIMAVLSNQNGVLVTGTSSGFAYVTVAGGKTIEIYAKRNGTTFTSSQLLNDSNGRTKIAYVKLAS